MPSSRGTAMQLHWISSGTNIEQVSADLGVASAGGSECSGHLNPLSVGGRATTLIFEAWAEPDADHIHSNVVAAECGGV